MYFIVIPKKERVTCLKILLYYFKSETAGKKPHMSNRKDKMPNGSQLDVRQPFKVTTTGTVAISNTLCQGKDTGSKLQP